MVSPSPYLVACMHLEAVVVAEVRPDDDGGGGGVVVVVAAEVQGVHVDAFGPLDVLDDEDDDDDSLRVVVDDYNVSSDGVAVLEH